MREVETFAKAGETAGAAVGTGVRTARKGANRARRQLAARIDPAPPAAPRRGRRWPWLLVLLASLGSAAAAVVLARRPQPVGRPGERQPTPPRPHHSASPHGNGFVGA